MSTSYQAQGIIHSIGATTEYGNNGFTKREFVIKLSGEGENDAYPNYIALELIKDKCALLDKYKQGDEIIAYFNLSGRLWQGQGKPEKCFTSLQAWRIQNASEVSATPGNDIPAGTADDYAGFDDGGFDDIPF